MRKIALWSMVMLICLGGCMTTQSGLTPGEIEILVRGAETAIANYLEAKGVALTAEQQLALDGLKLLVDLAIVKVREAGALAEAQRLETLLE